MTVRRLSLILIGLGAGLALLGGALLLGLPYVLDLPRIQALLRSEATRLLDRPVRFERASIGYWPLPAVRIRGLVVGNAPGFGTEPLLTVEEARVRVRLLPLLRGRLSFGEVTLTRPRVVVEQRRDGTWNLPAPGGTRPAPAAPFVLVSRVHLRDGHVELRVASEAGPAASAHVVDRIDLTLEDLGWSQPIRFQLEARLPGGGLSLAVDGRIGPLAVAGSDLATLPVRLAARFTAEETRPAADASFSLTGKGQGEIQAEGPLGNLVGGGRLTFSQVTLGYRPAACAGRPARPLALESVDLPVQIAGSTVTLQPFVLRLAGGTARGGAILTWRDGVPGVRLADVRIQGVAAAPILVDFLCQPYAVAGRLDASGEGAFSGTGTELLRSARGTWQVQVGPGRLVGPTVLTLLSGAVRVGTAVYSVVNLDTPASLFASPLEFDSLTVGGAVGGGQLRVRQLTMQGRQLRLTGSGTYGLEATRLDFDLEVRTGRTAFGVKLAGTTREPSYHPTGRGLLRSLTDALGTPRPSGGKRPASASVESGGR